MDVDGVVVALESLLGPPAAVHNINWQLLTVWVVLFIALYFVAGWAITPAILQPGYSTATRGDRKRSADACVSIAHLAIVVPTSLFIVLSGHNGDPTFEWNKLYEVTSYVVVAYFIFDLLFIVLEREGPVVERLAYVAHHIAAGGCFLHGIYLHQITYVGFICALTEISTIFLVLRFLRLVKYGPESRSSATGRHIELAMLVVFFLCRLVLCPIILYMLMFAHYERTKLVNRWHYHATLGSTMLVFLLSLFWWQKMVRNYIRHRHRKLK